MENKQRYFKLLIIIFIFIPLLLNQDQRVYSENKNSIENITMEGKASSQSENEGIKVKLIKEIADYIDHSKYSEVVNVFSEELYEDVPIGDAYEGQKYEITDLENTYNRIKTSSFSIAELIVNTNIIGEFNEAIVKRQLIVLTYLMRWGTFSDGSTLWKDLYCKKSNILSDDQVSKLNGELIKMFTETPEKSLASKNVNETFQQVYMGIGLEWTYKKSVEEYLLKNKKISDFSGWFYNIFSGTIYTNKYKDTNYDVGIWNRGRSFEEFLPYLLTLSSNSNLIIGETRGEIFYSGLTTYDGDQQRAKTAIINGMNTLNNVVELYDRTVEDKELINIDKELGQRSVLDQGRHWLDPQDTLSYELYRVAGYTGTYGGNAAVAGAGRIQLQTDRIEDSTTIAHEFAHELHKLFNTSGEYYSSYIEYVYRQPGAYVNVFANGDSICHQENIIANASVENFQSKSNLVNYCKNMEDAVYTLDTLIAIKVLSLPLEEQIKYIKLAEVDGEKGVLTTQDENVQIQDITVKQLEKLKIKTIDDLVDNNALIIQPGDTNKNIAKIYGQGFGTSLTFSSYFLLNGAAYEFNHRIINTLLSFDGWEAFRKFNDEYGKALSENSGKGLSEEELTGVSSLQALRVTYGDNSLNYSSLFKQRYHEVMSKLEKKGLIDQGYKEFLNSMTVADLNDLYNYKWEKLNKYFELSNEFSTPIFGDIISQSTTITAHYRDTEGNTISDDVVKTGNIGETYSTEQKKIQGYTFKEVQGNVSGQFTDKPQTVTYIYTKDPVTGGDVTAKYVDIDSNKIADDVVQSGNVGMDYSTDQLTIPGYTFKEVQGNPTGKFTATAQTVTYVYTKNKDVVVPPASTPDNNESNNKTTGHASTPSKKSDSKKALPETGEKEGIVPAIIGRTILVLLIGLVLFRKTKKSE